MTWILKWFSHEPQTDVDTERTDREESNTTPSQSRRSSIRPPAAATASGGNDSVDVFDGSMSTRKRVTGASRGARMKRGIYILKNLDGELEMETPRGTGEGRRGRGRRRRRGRVAEDTRGAPGKPVPELLTMVTVEVTITEEPRAPASQPKVIEPAPGPGPVREEPKPRRSKDRPPKIDHWHPLIVNLHYAFQDDENCCFFVLDIMLGGDLRFHLERLGSLDEEAVRVYFQFLDENNIMHWSCVLWLDALKTMKERLPSRYTAPPKKLIGISGVQKEGDLWCQLKGTSWESVVGTASSVGCNLVRRVAHALDPESVVELRLAAVEARRVRVSRWHALRAEVVEVRTRAEARPCSGRRACRTHYLGAVFKWLRLSLTLAACSSQVLML
ncbi:hypothetical protein B0H11DRAFT_1929902 [Mycena galericulata]|nr:hypothetical protein B0H11DRAFT_1929902 [Mycena galericulata]